MRIAASSATWSGAPTLPQPPRQHRALRRPRPGPKAPSPSRRHPPAPWTPPPAPESNRPGWLQLVLRFWWVGLLVIGGGIAAFNYLGGSRPVTEMSVGDCFDVPDVDAEECIDDVTKRECTEPHQYEMFFVGDLPDGRFPIRRRRWTNLVDANCIPPSPTMLASTTRPRCSTALPASRRPRTAGTTATAACNVPWTIRPIRTLTESQKDAAR